MTIEDPVLTAEVVWERKLFAGWTGKDSKQTVCHIFGSDRRKYSL